MGKNYASEIEQLPETYRWAAREPLGDLTEFVRNCSSRSLLAVGSGGSFSAASFAAYLHELATGCLARPTTPLEITSSPLDLRDVGTLLLTASGRNPDIRAAFDALAAREPLSIGILATRPGGPLGQVARKLSRASVSEFALPTGKDGYLATNSLLATLVLLARAYAEAGLIDWDLPADFTDLMSCDGDVRVLLRLLSEKTRPLLPRPNLLVLHSAATKPAAVDIESRFAEAAFGPVLTSDFRNFAHGRHLWLDRLGDTTAVLALVSGDTGPSAASLLRLIPQTVPVVELAFSSGLSGAISAVVTSILFASCIGKSRNVDPGQPHVPDFGRRMYNLKSLSRRPKGSSNGLTPAAAAAIQRKSRAGISRLERRGQLAAWMDAYRTFIGSLCSTTFSGIAFDYDGTLCDAARRSTGLRPEVATALTRLLVAGTPLAIATGRGKSVREQLQRAIPERFWRRVIVGYYNGSDIAYLCDDEHPMLDDSPEDLLASFQKTLIRHPSIGQFAHITVRPRQITVEPVTGSDVRFLWEVVHGVAEQHSPGQIRVLRSDHSVDVVRSAVSKSDTVRTMRELFKLPSDQPVLCIGDRGRWPGNDCDLLSGCGSLSVDETSPDPATCWNIAQPSVSHVDATLEYLSLLDPDGGRLRFSEERVRELYR